MVIFLLEFIVMISRKRFLISGGASSTTTSSTTTTETPTTTVEVPEEEFSGFSEDTELDTEYEGLKTEIEYYKDLNTVFVPVQATTTTTTTSVVTTTAAVTTLLATTAAPVMSTMQGARNLEEEDPRRAIEEQILMEINKAVKRVTEASIKEEEEREPVFGETETKLRTAYTNVVQTVEGASFTEIVAMMVGLAFLIFYLDKFIRVAFRYSVKKNYQYFVRHMNYEDEGDNMEKVKRWFWWTAEGILERIWIPMWWQSGRIRQTVLDGLVANDVEEIVAAENNRIADRNNNIIKNQGQDQPAILQLRREQHWDPPTGTRRFGEFFNETEEQRKKR